VQQLQLQHRPLATLPCLGLDRCNDLAARSVQQSKCRLVDEDKVAAPRRSGLPMLELIFIRHDHRESSVVMWKEHGFAQIWSFRRANQFTASFSIFRWQLRLTGP
jgi:hypothetical protein